MRRRYALLAIAGVALAFVVGHTVRGQLDLSPGAVHSWFVALRWKGPVIFVGLMTFRQFLLLPSAILLSIGGLSFGFAMGTALGCVGIVLSAVMKFSIARLVWRGSTATPRTQRFDTVRRRFEGSGPLLVGVVTAHPIGPMAWSHWAAGFSSMPLAAFALAVIIGSPIRAGAYALLGASLMAVGSVQLYAASTALIAMVLAPLAHPRLRRWMFAVRDLQSDAAP
jgi:uncharacterized membrane protein YdjX (TVP38/TMEM64 family)